MPRQQLRRNLVQFSRGLTLRLIRSGNLKSKKMERAAEPGKYKAIVLFMAGLIAKRINGGHGDAPPSCAPTELSENTQATQR